MSCWGEGTRDQYADACTKICTTLLFCATMWTSAYPLGPVVDKQCDDDCGASHLLVCQFVKTKSTDLSMCAYILCASYVVSLHVITDEVNYFTTEQL